MAITISYMVVYIIEALILWQYCSGLFSKIYSERVEGICFLSSYTLLYLISFFEIFWINLISFTIINFIIIFILYDIKWYTALFHTFIITIIMALSELGVLSIITYFSPGFYTNNYFRNVIIGGIFSKFTYFVILRFISGISGSIKNEQQLKPDRSIFYLNFVPAISTFIVVTITAICLTADLSLTLDWMISISAFLLLIFNILIFAIYNYSQKKNYEFMKMQLQSQKEASSIEYYKMLSEQTENQNILVHDLKKHLEAIAILNAKGNNKEVAEYINQIINSEDLKGSVKICDNEFLNTILSRYIKKCQKQKISLRLDIRAGILDSLNYTDLTALFCNLMDNAMEAAEKIPDSYIELSVTHNNDISCIIITMINSCCINPFSKKAGELISAKKRSLQHGYGMKSIKKITKKYNGALNVYYDDNNMEFHTIVTLNHAFCILPSSISR